MTALKMQLRERPRERLISCGPEALKDEELLAILFATGRKGVDVVRMSKELLDRYGSLKNLSRASVGELISRKDSDAVKGIGKAKAVQILAALELGKRAACQKERGGTLEEELERWAQDFKDEEREFIVAIFLDSRGRPVGEERLSYGGLDGASLDVSYLMRCAVRLGCSSLALIHNHSNGSSEASSDDLCLSRGVAKMLDVLNIEFYGHYIAAAGKVVRIPDVVSDSNALLWEDVAQRGGSHS
ncbi:MAG: JAB domain-containing protein [Pyramidobacter sp.]|jgi:DNA repair protein RadC